MKITRISVFQHSLPLKDPYWLSGGRLKFEVLDATFVKLETDTGLIGWGEGTPWGHTYVAAHGPGTRAGLETLAPVILGLDPRLVEHVERAMDHCLPGHLYAKQPVDMACWDILGQACGLPIADLLGGKRPSGTPADSSVSSGTPDDMLSLDIASGSGPRCVDGHITIDNTPGLGATPDEALLGDAVAVYEPG